jgi:Uncharacterized protein conserved in bacteria
MNRENNMTDLQKLKEMGSMKVFKAGDYIFKQGESGDEMYIILAGRVGISVDSQNNTPLMISHLENGDFLGEIALMDNLPRNTSAIAETDTTVISISKYSFQALICDSASIPYRIIIGLIHQINQLYHQLIQGQSYEEPVLPEISEPLQPTQTVQADHFETQNDSDPVENGNNPKISGYGNLFLEGHRTYNITAPNAYNEFLINASAKCPVCSEVFAAKKQYISKLKFSSKDNDFRKHYTDFEPLWYSVWVCPNCYYANFYTEFDAIPPHKKQNILAKNQELKKQFPSFKFTEPRSVDQVFTAYYLALVTAEFCNASSIKLGKIWLQLSWLYQDVNDQEMFNTASDMALKSYYDVLYKTGENISIDQMQQCFLLLGEMYMRKGDEKEALRSFYTAIKKDGGKEAFNQLAENRIHDIRKEKMNF